MPIADDHLLAHSCKTFGGQITVDSFIFRQPDGIWEEYLSAFWLNFLSAPPDTLLEQLEKLRAYVAAPPVPVVKPDKRRAYAVLSVGAIHQDAAALLPTRLVCEHAPEAGFEEKDCHSAIRPAPGTHQWPPVGKPSALLAIQLRLVQCIVGSGPTLAP